MKALSLWQPWASGVATGAKRHETRGWSTNYRGPLAIHAAQRKVLGDLLFELSRWDWQGALAPLVGKPIDLTGRSWSGVEVEHLPFGAVVAVVDLVDCIDTNRITVAELLRSDGRYYPERHFGDFGPDRFAWQLANLRPLAEPVPVRGRQGLWNLSESEEAAVRRQLDRESISAGHSQPWKVQG